MHDLLQELLAVPNDHVCAWPYAGQISARPVGGVGLEARGLSARGRTGIRLRPTLRHKDCVGSRERLRGAREYCHAREDGCDTYRAVE